ncbi:MAG: hypothetical protein ACYC5M_01350 [Anaerolineae bacterium]
MTEGRVTNRKTKEIWPKAPDTPQAPTFETAEWEAEPEPRRAYGARQVGYVVAILLNLGMLYVANNVLAWGVPFITGAWTAALWIVNLSLGAQIVVNLLWLAYDPPWFRRLGTIATNAISFASIYIMYFIFPFDLPVDLMNQALRIALLVGMVGIAIGTVVELVRLVFGSDGR